MQQLRTDPEELKSSVPSGEEVSQALRRCWQPVARLEDLQSGPQRAVLLGEALAVFLTESGEPVVVADRCGHRGASLSAGKVRGEGIQCPYHGWEWAGRNGMCTRIPSLDDQGQIPPRARVKAFPVRAQWGLVWTVLDEPLGEPPALPWFDAEEWTWGHGTPFELPVAFGLMIENFRDVAHFAFVHEKSFGPTPEVVEPLEPERDGLDVVLRRQMEVGEDATELWGTMKEIRYHVIAPNFTSVQMFTDKGERALLHAARAVGPTESMHYWVQGLSNDFEGGSLAEAIAFEERVYAEDRPVVSTVKPPELSLDPNADVNTLADRFTLAYRAAYADFVRRALAGSAQAPSTSTAS
jgi:phenylpropionate dioxygenase-like ring-hydroxylating dioxygenase large terminal subunit